MADLGMTIVTVVHQPRYGIFVLFDEVLLLGKAGRTVFQGPSPAALPYFNTLGFELPPNENPADFCLDVISGSIPCQGQPDFQPEASSHPLQLAWFLRQQRHCACKVHANEMHCQCTASNRCHQHSLPWHVKTMQMPGP